MASVDTGTSLPFKSVKKGVMMLFGELSNSKGRSALAPT